MRVRNRPSRSGVIVGAAVVVALAAGLVVRLVPRAEASSPESSAFVVPLAGAPAPGQVPIPLPLETSELPTPRCWGCPSETGRLLEFSIDLDRLAPLGDGDANAATWLAQFAVDVGPRVDETRGRTLKREVLGRTGQTLADDDPLLLEAEPWLDQARCRFYPEVFEFDGANTQIANLRFALQLGRSWVARGTSRIDDPEAAYADHRRTLRLGRLLLQDDLVLIQNLVGIALVRMGAEGIYHTARHAEDATTLAAAAIVLGDVHAMRLRISQDITPVSDIVSGVRLGWRGRTLVVGDTAVETALRMGREALDRPMRLEGLMATAVVSTAGSRDQRAAAEEVLAAALQDEDPFVAAMAEWLDRIDTSLLPEWLGL